MSFSTATRRVIDILVLMGMSCAGKDYISKELINMGYKKIVSYTTRPMRPGEVDGVTYKYISKDKFLELDKEGFFAENTSYNVATGETWYYGISIEDLSNADENSVVILNPEGLRKVKQIDGLHIVSFLIDAKKSTLKRRLKERGDNRKEAKRRLKADKKDFKDIEIEVDFVIDNNYENTESSQSSLIDFIYKNMLQKEWR